MTRIHTLLGLLALGAGLTACAAPAASPAQPETSAGAGLAVEGAWARQSPMEATNGAVYMTLRNSGAAEDRLLGAASDVAATVELHETTSSGGMMSMSPVAAIPVPAGGSVDLAPGGYHVMLIDLVRPLEAGQTIPVTLTFEQAGTMTVMAEVRAE
jgi:copper(I)-binding protein